MGAKLEDPFKKLRGERVKKDVDGRFVFSSFNVSVEQWSSDNNLSCICIKYIVLRHLT